MSSETRSTTWRCLNHFVSSWATRPSISSLARRPRRRRGTGAVLGVLGALVLGMDDRRHPVLLAGGGHAPILIEEDRDHLARDDVVLLPDTGVADEHHPLLEIVVFSAARGTDAAVTRHDAHVAGGHRSQDAIALLVEIDLHAVGVLHRAVLAGDDLAGEDDQALLAVPLHLIGAHRHRLAALLARLRRRRSRALRLRGRLPLRLRGRLRLGPGTSRHQERRDDGERDDGGGPHDPDRGLKVACTRPRTVVASSAILTSSAVPSITVPSRVMRTGLSVHSRRSSPFQRSTAVSSLRPSSDTMTTLCRTSKSLVSLK